MTPPPDSEAVLDEVAPHHAAHHAVSDEALDAIFREARTHRHWQDKPVSNALLMAIYDLMRWGPTETNFTPARFHFVVSKDAKARLEPLLDKSNRVQTMAAPATAIVGYDLDFPQTIPKPWRQGLWRSPTS